MISSWPYKGLGARLFEAMISVLGNLIDNFHWTTPKADGIEQETGGYRRGVEELLQFRPSVAMGTGLVQTE